MIPEILFFLSLAAIVHSYLFFPWLVNLLSKGKKANQVMYKPEDDLPFVSILVSVHNEDEVIITKIRSIYNTLYPLNKFELLIGSDASTDSTNLICKIYSENYDSLNFFPFKVRQGKPAIINNLVDRARGNILILTDARVFFERETMYELVRHFRNPEIDIVGGNIINEKVSPKGISMQEKAFMSREIRLKYLEGLIWGKTMGVYGGVYAIRKEAFTKVPGNFTVDDFFITMQVLLKKRKVILDIDAITLEDVPDDLGVEFKRKIRISAGNFQNLRVFISCLFPPWSALSFVFFSHKVLRWFGPFFLVMILATNIYLAFSSGFFMYLLYIQTFLLILPIIDLILRKINLHIIILRFVTHFYFMNLALMLGFFRSIFGKKTSIWQPTRRQNIGEH